MAYTRHQGVTLTPHGREIGSRMVRYHRLAERYLAEVLGLPWDQVHAEAEELEHALSERVVGRMDALMGSPSPIRTASRSPVPPAACRNGSTSRFPRWPLGEAATVARVKPTDPELLRYLGGLGIYPQVTLTVEAAAPFDGPVTVWVAGQRHAIGRAVAAEIFAVDVHVCGSGVTDMFDADGRTLLRRKKPARRPVGSPRWRGLAAMLLLSVLLAACAPPARQSAVDLASRKIRVVTTVGMITDVVRQVGGERVTVTGLMGPGVDPHLYKASEGDVLRLGTADVVFYGGLHLEAKLAEVLERMQDRVVTAAVTDGIDRPAAEAGGV